VGGLRSGAWKFPRLSPSRLAFGSGTCSSSSVEGVAVLGVRGLKPGLRDDLDFWVSAGVLGVHLLPCPFSLGGVLLSSGRGFVLPVEELEELEGVPWLPEILRADLPSIVLIFSKSVWVLKASEFGAGALWEELCTRRAFFT